jgi:hypothetical protein
MGSSSLNGHPSLKLTPCPVPCIIEQKTEGAHECLDEELLMLVGGGLPDTDPMMPSSMAVGFNMDYEVVRGRLIVRTLSTTRWKTKQQTQRPIRTGAKVFGVA